MRFADIAIVVANAEVTSGRDWDRIIGLLDFKTERAEKGEQLQKHLLLTRYDAGRVSHREMLSVDDVLEILAIPLLGIVPESEEVLRASNLGSPITLHNPASAPARAYRSRPTAARPQRRSQYANGKEGLPRQALRSEGRMSLFSLFRGQTSAPVASERGQNPWRTSGFRAGFRSRCRLAGGNSVAIS